jgi:hypothetical protein
MVLGAICRSENTLSRVMAASGLHPRPLVLLPVVAWRAALLLAGRALSSTARALADARLVYESAAVFRGIRELSLLYSI